MEIIKFENFEIINEAFGSKETEFGRRVKYRVMGIMADINHISEKDFKRLDILKDVVDEIFELTPEITDALKRYERLNSRVEFCAEHIYQWFIKGTELEEKI
jgi:hypothetical protein